MTQLIIPVYYTKPYKRKKDRTFLVSLNWYRNAYYQEQNEVKQYFHDLITEQLGDNPPKWAGQYKVTYEYYYRNKTSDLANVTPMCSKWVNDVLQGLGCVQNDNVNFLVEETHIVRTQDRKDPRAVVTISAASSS